MFGQRARRKATLNNNLRLDQIDQKVSELYKKLDKILEEEKCVYRNRKDCPLGENCPKHIEDKYLS